MTKTQMRANVRQAVPLFGVRDMAESLRFYVDGLGCTMTEQWVDDGKVRWCWLVLGDAAVMLQEFWNEGHDRNVPETPVGIGVSMNFICTDAVALYREFRQRGLDPKRPFVGNKMWVTEAVDPDGYQLCFESPTDVPEETVLSDDAAA